MEQYIDYHFMEFWREILRSGVISDVSFTPRWRKSLGANDEHKTVIGLSLPHKFIMQVRKNVLLVRSCCLNDSNHLNRLAIGLGSAVFNS